MSKIKNNFTSSLEWESFNWSDPIYNIKSKNNCYNIPINSRISIFRNNEYKLTGKLYSDSEEKRDLQYHFETSTPVAGDILKGDIITATDTNSLIKYELRHFFIGNVNNRYSGNTSKLTTHTEADILFYEIEEVLSDSETFSLYEFYLSSNIDQLFPRKTHRSKTEKIKKTRHTVDNDEVEERISFRSEGVSSDFFLVETKEFDLIVQKVSNEFLPDWANGIQIEYRQSFKSIPNEETREGISEIISFVLGSHLLKVGESHFDKHNNISRRIAFSPWGDNVISKSKSPALPPVSFKDYMDWQKIERVLNKLLPKYLEKKNILGLSDVLWKYWISKELAVGTNLPVLSSALEVLAENYVETNGLVLTYTKEQKTIYRELIVEDKNSISKKIENYDFKNRVLNTIENPFELSAGQKLKIFFSHISIDFSNNSVENQALKARNKMVHGSISDSEEETKKYIDLTRAYRTLINRIILKVLDFDEKYIDYYTSGFPEKSLEENI